MFLSIENKILMESFKNNFFGILALKQIAQESLFSFLLRIKTSPNNQAIVAINIYHCVWCARGDSSKLEIKSFRANLVNIFKGLIAILCLTSKETKVFSKNLLVKSSGNNFIFLPAFYLIKWLMTSPFFFLNIAILNI